MSEIEALRFLIGFAALVFVAEDWCLRPQLESDGPRAWSVQRRDFGWSREFFDLAFSSRGLWLTLVARAVAAVSLLVSPHWGDAAVLILGTWLWSVRWRGTFNGGSDAMTLIVLVGLLINLIDPAWERFALIYVGVHLVASFLVAGLAKLRNPEWRDGRAPSAFLGVGVPKLCAWLVILFEVSFPLGLTSLGAAWFFTIAGVAFHLVNAYVFGLNRFLLAWLAAYPALIYLSK